MDLKKKKYWIKFFTDKGFKNVYVYSVIFFSFLTNKNRNEYNINCNERKKLKNLRIGDKLFDKKNNDIYRIGDIGDKYVLLEDANKNTYFFSLNKSKVYYLWDNFFNSNEIRKLKLNKINETR